MRVKIVGLAIGVALASAIAVLPHAYANESKASTVTPDIIGGTTVSSAPWGAQVSSGGAFCSGSIIAPQWVLTAAHCLGGGAVSVRVGDVRLGQGKQARGDRTFKHGDTGLIHLTTSISTTYAQLASTDPPVGAQVEIYGWGGISAPGGPLAKQLKMAVVRVTQVDSMVHAVQVTGAAYHGDSGGPMFYQGKQIGTCTGQAGAEFIYPSVAQARSWIRQTSGV